VTQRNYYLVNMATSRQYGPTLQKDLLLLQCSYVKIGALEQVFMLLVLSQIDLKDWLPVKQMHVASDEL